MVTIHLVGVPSIRLSVSVADRKALLHDQVEPTIALVMEVMCLILLLMRLVALRMVLQLVLILAAAMPAVPHHLRAAVAQEIGIILIAMVPIRTRDALKCDTLRPP